MEPVLVNVLPLFKPPRWVESVGVWIDVRIDVLLLATKCDLHPGWDVQAIFEGVGDHCHTLDADCFRS